MSECEMGVRHFKFGQSVHADDVPLRVNSDVGGNEACDGPTERATSSPAAGSSSRFVSRCDFGANLSD